MKEDVLKANWDIVRGVTKVHVGVPSFDDRWMGFVFSPAELSSSPWTP